MDIKKIFSMKVLLQGGAVGGLLYWWASDKIDTLCSSLVTQAQGLINRGACIPQTQGWDVKILPFVVGIGVIGLIGYLYDEYAK